MAEGSPPSAPILEPPYRRINQADSSGAPSRVEVRTDWTPEEWDCALLAAPNASLLQSWRWGEFKREADWSPFRIRVGEPLDGEGARPPLSVCAQVLFRTVPRLPFPVSIAYIPRWSVHVSDRGGSSAIETRFWSAVHKEARKRGAIFLKIEPNLALGGAVGKESVSTEMAARRFRSSGRLQPARTIVLDLDKSEDDLLKAMKPKTRYNIRLAGRRGVQVRRGVTLDDLRAFHSLLQVTGERDEFGIHEFPYYEEMWRVFGPGGDNSALLLLADHPGEAERAEGPIAGLLALKFGPEAIYMYGASANRGREHMPTYLLQWEAIRWAREQGAALYDFWGIPDPPSEDEGEEVSPTNTRSGLRGVYWFKKGFGGREIDYPGAYDFVYNPLLYKVWMRWRGANLG